MVRHVGKIAVLAVIVVLIAATAATMSFLYTKTGFLQKAAIDAEDEKYYSFDAQGRLIGAGDIQLNGSSTCWVMAHGYTAVPDGLRIVGEAIHDTFNDTVYMPLLSGHGMHSSGIERYTINDWYNQIAELAQQHNCTYLLGTSMGASIVLRYAELHQVQGVVATGTPFEPKPSMLPMDQVMWTFWKLGRYTKKKSPGETIDDPEGNSSHIASPRFPLKGAVELNEFNKIVLNDLERMQSPVLFIHGINDTVEDLHGAYAAYERINAPKDFYVVPDSDHIVFRDFGKKRAVNAVLTFREGRKVME